MTTFLRSVRDLRSFWRIWLPLMILAMLSPLLAVSMPLVEKRLIDDVILARRSDLLLETATLYASVWLFSAIIMIVSSALRSYLGERVTVFHRQRLFAHSEGLSVAFSRQEHSGRIVSLFVNDTPSVANLFSTTIIGGIASVIGIVVAGIVMFQLNAQLAIAAAVGPPVIALIAAVVTRPLRPAARRSQEKAAELNQRLQENLAGIREVVAFGQEARQSLRFGAIQRQLLRLRMRVTYIETAILTGASLFSLAATVVILVYGAYLVIEARTTLGSVVAMRALFGLVFQPAGQLVGMIAAAQKALGAADRIYAFLDQRPAVSERSHAREPGAVRGEVAFESVSFAYDTDQSVLQDVSFVGQPGELIALVGPSGAGKSTTVSLIARFYDPTTGRVLLDGIDVRDLTLSGLRREIGMVFQDTFLFDGSIRDNVVFGSPDASEAEIVFAVQTAHAWEFIERLPKGIDTPVGERGVHLSEGQKQRIAIARALLRNPKILILDEPTSALDARSEHLLQAALDNLMRGRTTFVIAHRLATVRRADRILVIDDGRIVEQGTHNELLARNGLYRELFDLQFRGIDVHETLAPYEPLPLHSNVPAIQRTPFVIAQELPDGRHPGRILVLLQDQVVEAGTHDELMARDGVYRELVIWGSSWTDDAPTPPQRLDTSPVALTAD